MKIEKLMIANYETLTNTYNFIISFLSLMIQDDDSLITMGIDEVDAFVQDDGHIVLRNLLLV